MNKHALVVACAGSPGSGCEMLRGVDGDAQLMGAALEQRGFRVTSCTGAQATRDGILAAYDKLVDTVRDGDAAVFYYAGHGYYTPVIGEGGLQRRAQGIVPADLGQSTEHDHRGISSWELSILQNRLLAKTLNVTTILDCCHSSQMSRNAGALTAVARALPHPQHVTYDALHAALRERYRGEYDRLDSLGNPHAVRLVACGPAESAYEYQRAGEGTYRGVFTEALLAVLREVGDAQLSWSSLREAVRGRVLRLFPHQCPDMEGPTARQLFTAIPAPGTDTLSLARIEGKRYQLSGGTILGVNERDVYGAMPVTSRAYLDSAAYAELEVTKVSATQAEAVVTKWRNDHTEIPDGAAAIELIKQVVRHAVAVDAPDDASRATVEHALVAARTLRPVPAGDATAIATLRVSREGVTVEDTAGPLFPPFEYPTQLDLAVKNAANLGASLRLRALEGEHGVYARELDLEFGALDGAVRRPMADAGVSLGSGDRIYLSVGAGRAQRRLYAHVFNLGVRGRIALLSGFAAAGMPLVIGDAPYVLGEAADGTLVGLPLSWPEQMDPTVPRTDHMLLIVTTRQVNLHALETKDFLGNHRATSTKLADLLAQIQDGLHRDVRMDTPVDAYFVKRFSYTLQPRTAAMVDIPYAIDDNPLRLGGARGPGSWQLGAPVPPARRVSITLDELALANPAALGSTNLRLDALVCTRAPAGTLPYAAWTHPLRNVTPSTPIPLAAPLFDAAARGFCDIHLWLSRDLTGTTPPLAQLLAERHARPAIADSLTALALGPSPVSGAIAAGASAALARSAYDALRSIPTDTIGLFRTSLTSDDGFSPGRQPRAGLLRSPDGSVGVAVRVAVTDAC